MSAQNGRPRRLSRHPYRDSAIMNGVLAALVVVIATLTGGGWVRAVIVAVVVFLLATGWSWWRLRQRADDPRRVGR